MLSPLKTLQRLFALVGLAWLAGAGSLTVITGQATPCGAMAVLTDPLIPATATDVVNGCMGERGEAGLPGLVLELGLAVAGQTREKMAKQVEGRLKLDLRAGLMQSGELRCSVLLLEAAAGREGGGPRYVAQSLAREYKQACRGGAEGRSK